MNILILNGSPAGDDSITLQAAMDSIACEDYRFSYVPGSWGISDIRFFDYEGTDLALSVSPDGFNYWWCNLNGWASQMSYDLQMLVDGKFVTLFLFWVKFR